MTLSPPPPTHFFHVLAGGLSGDPLIKAAARACRRRGAATIHGTELGNAILGRRLASWRATPRWRPIGCYPGRGRPLGYSPRSSSANLECNGEPVPLQLVQHMGMEKHKKARRLSMAATCRDMETPPLATVTRASTAIVEKGNVMTVRSGTWGSSGRAASVLVPVGTLTIRPAWRSRAPASRCVRYLLGFILPIGAAMGTKFVGGIGRLGRPWVVMKFGMHELVGPRRGLGRQLLLLGAGSKSYWMRVTRTSGGHWMTMQSALHGDVAAKRLRRGLPPGIGLRRLSRGSLSGSGGTRRRTSHFSGTAAERRHLKALATRH